MKQTILSYDQLSQSWCRFKQSVVYAMGVLAMLLLSSLQGAQAQTISDFSEVRANSIINELTEEANFLLEEALRDQSGQALVFNKFLGEFYVQVGRDFANGADLSDVMSGIISVVEANAEAGRRHSNYRAVVVSKTDLLGHQAIVDSWTTDAIDLNQVFQYWRTIKNR